MGVTFSLADEEARKVVDRALRLYHPDLAEAGVRVGVLFASSDKEGVPALKSKGTTLAATMQVVGLKDRVLKGVDCQMVINLQAWESMSEARQLAVADHEWCHVALKDGAYWKVFDADGRDTGRKELRFDVDDLGRPKLVSVPGDRDVGDGFAACVRRHGVASLEYQNMVAAGKWAEREFERGPDDAADARPDAPRYDPETGEIVFGGAASDAAEESA